MGALERIFYLWLQHKDILIWCIFPKMIDLVTSAMIGNWNWITSPDIIDRQNDILKFCFLHRINKLNWEEFYNFYRRALNPYIQHFQMSAEKLNYIRVRFTPSEESRFMSLCLCSFNYLWLNLLLILIRCFLFITIMSDWMWSIPSIWHLKIQ